MGCGTSKEKVENEMMKLQMERAQVQMERINQLKLLEEIGYRPFKRRSIPDYIAPENNNINKKITSSSNLKKLKTDNNPKRAKSHRNLSHFTKKKKNSKKEKTK